MKMELGHAAFGTKRHNNIIKELHKGGTGFFIISLPANSRVLRVIVRCLLLAILVIVSLPWLGSMLGGYDQGGYEYDPMNFELLPTIFRDLTNEGLLKSGDRALFVSRSGNEEAIYNSLQIQLKGNYESMDLISHSDLERQSSIPDKTFDFIFAFGFQAATAQFIDRTLKIGGIATLQPIDDDPSLAFLKPFNYKIVYLRRFDSTVMAMRKTGNAHTSSPMQRRLFGFASEAKKAALNKLEDVLLEPPRAASGKSNAYLKRTRYLPDLMDDSLESYPRRIFIAEGGDTGWFARNYPTRNRDFEMYKIETVTEESSAQVGMSDWLRKNVKEEEYVVMKAEAEVVEEMVESKAIGLVDELFLECKHQGLGRKGNRSRRAYWECLALYGRLRDEGVAVHQWWG